MPLTLGDVLKKDKEIEVEANIEKYDVEPKIILKDLGREDNKHLASEIQPKQFLLRLSFVDHIVSE